MSPAPIGKFFARNFGWIAAWRESYADASAAVLLRSADDGEVLAKLSTALSATQPGCFWAKTWSENEEIAAAVLASGLFVDTGQRAQAGYAEAQLWRIAAPGK